ncbi:Thioredoxin superfamily protein [Perilla frutescens var. hirtella]|uniref:Thioredoxin superfamily protein n=1 Tax=Perilla frutescens var. hirtella TaxID=608512 RepID=A0AAD4J941_PERFH|nr:Thioredoxin superfamily protein [Perilla frutescens var. frutescens]KAH6790338.1 Thioredoxin superfamily protein [Perilla frutescens var. frutescens]KAH6792957.1 Thioredoxin superfamily protein [Perilla frutescens var. hirtella]KAH6829116.1 Thioredoxin superfamily protein [Perilla frutescens var. hirtella]
MQKALLYRNLLPPASSAGESAGGPVNVRKLVAEKAVVVFARKGCCMCHVVKLLLNGHGVNPTILDVDDQNEGDVTNELSRIGVGAAPQFPAVFVGGELFGGLEQVMGAHISGELVPRLREARALWL